MRNSTFEVSIENQRTAGEVLHNIRQWSPVLGAYKAALEELPVIEKALVNYQTESMGVDSAGNCFCPVCESGVSEKDNYCRVCGKSLKKR